MTLFDPEPGGFHRDDPETSKQAALDPKNMLVWGTQRYVLLLTFLGRHSGLTADTAGELAGVGNYSQRRRCSELEKAGFLEPTGAVTEGKRILRITLKGEAALREVKQPAGLDYQGNEMKEVT